MTIRTSDLGGTDWADGDIGFAADFNDTFGAVTVHRKQFSDATERTTSSTSFVDSGTGFTLTAPVGVLLLGFNIKADLKNESNSQSSQICLEIEGSNLGTLFLVSLISTQGTDPSISNLDISTSEAVLFLSNSVNTNYLSLGAVGGTPLKILDTSTTIKVRLRSSSGDAFVKNVTIDVVYVNNFSED